MEDTTTNHPPPNYVNPPKRPPWVEATSIIYLTLVVATTGLRLYTRFRFRRQLGLDDCFALTGTVCSRTVSAIWPEASETSVPAYGDVS